MIQAKLISYLIGFITVLVAILGYGHYQYKKGVDITTLSYENALSKQKLEASNKLIEVKEQVHTAEQALQDFKNTQELKDADHQKVVSYLMARRNTVVLRDPNAARCGISSSGSSGKITSSTGLSTANGTQASGVLSPELTDLLWDKFAEADQINNAYASCQAYALKVRE